MYRHSRRLGINEFILFSCETTERERVGVRPRVIITAVDIFLVSLGSRPGLGL